MISIGNNKISEIYVGSTKIKEVYVGSVKVYPETPSIVWYDDEFKSVALTALGLSDNTTQEQLDAVTDTQFASVSFKNNTTIKTIADLAKFTSVTKIPDNCFYGCTSLGTDETVQDGTTLVIPSNISTIGNYAFQSCSGYKSITIEHVCTLAAYTIQNTTGCFSKMSGLEGVIDLTNLRGLSHYHEFDGIGKSGAGIQIVMPDDNQSTFGTWFVGAKLTAMASTVDDLEDNVIKIPNHYTEIAGYTFAANYFKGVQNSFILDSVEKVNSIIGGDNSSTLCKSITFGENCKYITGPCLSDNENNYTIICKSTTPPILGLGGIGYSNGDDVEITLTDGNTATIKASETEYPFMYTSRVTAVYVPDDAVDTYKADIKAGVKYQNEMYELTTNEGAVACNGTSNPTAGYPSYGEDYTVESRIVGWSRFADKIKPMSELTQ